MRRPLDGVAIVEAASGDCALGLRLAIALAGRIAADLGADVLKLEPPEGDPVRRIPPLLGEGSALFAFLNAGKRSVALPSSAAGEEAARRLAENAAAIIADAGLARTGDLTRAVGERLPEEAPRIAVLVSLLGAPAPAAIAASEFTVMALGGMLDIVGDPAREPLRLGGHQAAYAAGLAAYAGLAAALGGAGPRRETVHVSMLETVLWLNWKNLATASWSGAALSRPGRGAEWQVLRCADGWVALVYQEGDWPALSGLVDDPRLAEPRFARREQRLRHLSELAAIVEERFRGLTRREIRAAALARKLPLGPVWSAPELAEDPHILARGFLCRVALDRGGSVAMPRLPVIWSGAQFPPGPVPPMPAATP